MRRGFSLVELSIVLVIIGLLAGGIMAGLSLQRAAELRAVANEYNRYVTATTSFVTKYGTYPGDLANATTYWGVAPVCPGVAANSRIGVAGTCDGDGNGQINYNAPNCNETFCYWDHLVRAGMLEGAYSGVTGHASVAGNTTVVAGINVPQSRVNGGVWMQGSNVGGAPVDVSNAVYLDGDYGMNFFILAAPQAVGVPRTALLKPEEAWNVDTKMDDGLAGTGKVVTLENLTNCYLLSDGSAGTTSTTATRQDVTYNLAYTSPACGLVFKNVF